MDQPTETPGSRCVSRSHQRPQSRVSRRRGRRWPFRSPERTLLFARSGSARRGPLYPRAMSAISVTREGDGPEILLVHGGASPDATWGALAPLRARWTLASVHRRGYPPSPPPLDGRQDFELDAADVLPLLSSRPQVAAHSYGVLGTLIAAGQRPDDGRSLTLMEGRRCGHSCAWRVQRGLIMDRSRKRWPTAFVARTAVAFRARPVRRSTEFAKPPSHRWWPGDHTPGSSASAMPSPSPLTPSGCLHPAPDTWSPRRQGLPNASSASCSRAADVPKASRRSSVVRLLALAPCSSAPVDGDRRRDERSVPARPGRLPGDGVEAVLDVDARDLDDQRGHGGLVVVAGGLTPDVVGDGVGPIGESGEGLGQLERRALGLGIGSRTSSCPPPASTRSARPRDARDRASRKSRAPLPRPRGRSRP